MLTAIPMAGQVVFPTFLLVERLPPRGRGIRTGLTSLRRPGLRRSNRIDAATVVVCVFLVSLEREAH